MGNGDQKPTRTREHALRLTHQDAEGRPRMVDVVHKPHTHRVAMAEGVLFMRAETVEALMGGRTPKGDPLTVAQVAGIQAAKRTADLIPLCHPLALSRVDVHMEVEVSLPGVRATATVEVRGPTGVEMEALTAVSVALLTAYDMLKALDRSMTLGGVRLLSKTGGRTGTWTATTPANSTSNEIANHDGNQ